MFIGVDIGGTNTKIGIVSKLGRVVAVLTFKTHAPIDPDNLIQEIQKNITYILRDNDMSMDDIEAIGVGVPGVVNNQGIIVRSVNLDWKDVDIKSKLALATSKRVEVGNDANCAMLAEWSFGGAKGAQNAILITLGTGIGSGIILEGKLYRGSNGMGGECGHMVIVQNGEQCNCGNKGCWERYASASALSRRTEFIAAQNPDSKLNAIMSKFHNKASAHTCFEAMRQGDVVAKQLVDEYIEYVVCGLINLTQIFHPEIFIIGGGVAKEGPAFIKIVDAKLNGFLAKNSFEPKVQVRGPVLENNAGIVGAAALGMIKNE